MTAETILIDVEQQLLAAMDKLGPHFTGIGQVELRAVPAIPGRASCVGAGYMAGARRPVVVVPLCWTQMPLPAQLLVIAEQLAHFYLDHTLPDPTPEQAARARFLAAKVVGKVTTLPPFMCQAFQQAIDRGGIDWPVIIPQHLDDSSAPLGTRLS